MALPKVLYSQEALIDDRSRRCTDICPEHSGQEERIASIQAATDAKIKGVHGKLDVLLWVLGMLIAVVIAVGGYLSTSVNNMNTTTAVAIQRLTTLELAGQQRPQR